MFHSAWNKGLTKETDERVAQIGRKNSESLTGSKWSETGRRNHELALSRPETLKAISEGTKKGMRDPEIRKKCASGRLGKSVTLEERKKQRHSHLGRKYKSMSEQGKKNLSEAHVGKKPTLETRKRMSVSQKGLKKPKHSETMRRLYREGIIKPSGRSMLCKAQWYDSPSAGRIYLRSSYEFVVARWLDERKIPWSYEDIKVQYIDLKGVKRTYFVDFHRLDYGGRFCIECKGWMSPLTQLKTEAFHRQYPDMFLRIVMEKDLSLFRTNPQKVS